MGLIFPEIGIAWFGIRWYCPVHAVEHQWVFSSSFCWWLFVYECSFAHSTKGANMTPLAYTVHNCYRLIPNKGPIRLFLSCTSSLQAPSPSMCQLHKPIHTAKMLSPEITRISPMMFICSQWLLVLHPRSITVLRISQCMAVCWFVQVGMSISTLPDGFNPHKGIKRVFESRKKMIETGEGVDWGFAEALAFGTLVSEGKHVNYSSHSHMCQAELASWKHIRAQSSLNLFEHAVTTGNKHLADRRHICIDQRQPTAWAVHDGCCCSLIRLGDQSSTSQTLQAWIAGNVLELRH